ncbi:PhzF family phenazine biosynthesis protein [Echinicola strongylocentroti]|uniref:PhzF family phenazine biosynthesis protein n=1 Tax=Echinicola strongylocentroti TaxID=1795355 RepID=A0A2Z4INY9_9BACT|nr:PhzF family phenazine biosynthesis isomerase [Echinicola strongylocentroti]AWW32564.1 PhzF family phenazine biosynthesis protein [Echinicola strongylocentroti]
MEIDYQVISVFTDQNRAFKGNPSAVVVTEKLLSEGEMQEIAKRLHQPATTFLAKMADEGRYAIRWFAPDAAIGLCGHGTAAATAYLGTKKRQDSAFTFVYADGLIHGKLNADQTVSISTASIKVVEELPEIPEAIVEGLGIPLLSMYRTANKYIILVKSETDLRRMVPDFERLKDCAVFGYAITAQGEEVDFVSRTLVPHTVQKEDHATGSSHAMLVPFWAERLGKKHMLSLQFSERGGAFACALEEDGLVVLTGAFLMEESGKLSL